MNDDREESPSAGMLQAVEAEITRRKNLLRLYLFLLLIPIATFLLFLKYGRTDREIVRSEVERRVSPAVEKVETVESRLIQNETSMKELYDSSKRQYDEVRSLSREIQQQFPVPPAQLAERLKILEEKAATIEKQQVQTEQLLQRLSSLEERTSKYGHQLKDQDVLLKRVENLESKIKTIVRQPNHY